MFSELSIWHVNSQHDNHDIQQLMTTKQSGILNIYN